MKHKISDQLINEAGLLVDDNYDEIVMNEKGDVILKRAIDKAANVNKRAKFDPRISTAQAAGARIQGDQLAIKQKAIEMQLGNAEKRQKNEEIKRRAAAAGREIGNRIHNAAIHPVKTILHPVKAITGQESVTITEAAEPLGDQRVQKKNGIKILRFRKNEASGHSSIQKEIIQRIDSGKLDRVWVVSDTHFFKKDLDPIRMNQFITLMNMKADTDDLIIFLGDIVTAESDETTAAGTVDMLARLKCMNTVLVLGNNDNLSVKEYYDCGYYYVTDILDTKRFHFSHFPEQVGGETINVHGHIHDKTEIYNINADNHINAYYYGRDGQSSRIETLATYVKMLENGEFDYLKTVVKSV